MTKKTGLWMILALSVSMSAWGADGKGINCKDDSLYPEIDKQELTSSIESKNVTVIDVNSADSFKKDRIPTAVHFGANQKSFAKVLPQKKDALIVAYCGGPSCTAWKKAAQEACKMGYTNIKHFKPGISGWAESTPTS